MSFCWRRPAPSEESRPIGLFDYADAAEDSSTRRDSLRNDNFRFAEDVSFLGMTGRGDWS
jgi:hypothetical protein